MKRKVILYIEVLICVIKNRMQEPVNALGVFKVDDTPNGRSPEKIDFRRFV